MATNDFLNTAYGTHRTLKLFLIIYNVSSCIFRLTINEFQIWLVKEQTNWILNQANRVKFENLLPPYLNDVLETLVQ